MLTQTKLKIIFFLLDNEGHSGRDLAECLEIKESNLNPVLHEMEDDMHILYHGPAQSRNLVKIRLFDCHKPFNLRFYYRS